ncbi:MAG: chemotaxis protein CheB [Rhodanobacteraceae bacterium]
MPETSKVALLYQTASPSRDTRDALTENGIDIAYEAALDALSASALQDSGAEVVLINLDADVEAHLDGVQRLLDEANCKVIFNDSEVSSRLTGWERARWLRHLVAKIRGAADVDPPRPGARTPVPDSRDADAHDLDVDGDGDEVHHAEEVRYPEEVHHADEVPRAEDVPQTGEVSQADDSADPDEEFSVDTISAEQFLAPDAPPEDEESANTPSTLELMPLDLTPTEHADAAAHTHAPESWLDPDAPQQAATSITRVWVLGAGIGGPEAVGEFLAGLPRGYPALFLLVQQMGADFVDQMTRQLARTTALAVRQARGGESVADGDVIVMLADEHLAIGDDRRVTVTPDTADHESLVDRVLGEIADAFGARAGAILFSGTVAEVGDGARRVIEKGGLIFAQDSETCVIGAGADTSELADDVSFTGSPTQLAERLRAPDLRGASKKG